MAAADEYGLAIGHDIALASIPAIATVLGSRNRRTLTSMPKGVGIQSQPVDVFPVRRTSLSGKERGDGRIDHQWQLVLATYGVKYLLDTYLSGGSVVSAAVTINTRRHELATFERYNAYLVLPKPGQDIEYIRQGVFRLTLRFTSLEAL